MWKIITFGHLTHYKSKMQSVSEESISAVFVTLVAAVFTSILSFSLACNNQFECLKSKTCHAVDDGSCSFSNFVSPAGFKIFNTSSDVGVLAELTRGVCSAGERQMIDEHARLVCVRGPSFPDAFNSEAANTEADTDHERACGRWIASSSNAKSEYFAFYDEQQIADDIMTELKTEFNPFIVTDDIDRFRAACETMVVNNAVSVFALKAYEFIKHDIDSIGTTLGSLGRLASYYCDGPIAIGSSVASDANFYPTFSDGAILMPDAASEAMYSMGEALETREKARVFIEKMTSMPASSTPSSSELNEILSGAIHGSWLEDAVAISPPNILIDRTLLAGQRFLYALRETDTEHANAYLLAVAAQCAFAVRSVASGEFGSSINVKEETHRIKKSRRTRAAGLGRLHPELERFESVNSSMVFEATIVSWSAIAITDGLFGSSTDACFNAAATAFPDEFDTRVLEKVTSMNFLSSKLTPLVSHLKEAVAITLQNGKISTLVSDPVERANLAQNARSVVFKVAGATRESEFGRDGEFAKPQFTSDDGALLMLVKQARAVFLDRLALSLENKNVCELPPIYPSLSRNAYLLGVAPCAMILPALLLPPISSNRYDEKSLYSRLGFIVAHETAHVASKLELWDGDERNRLLVNYTIRSTHAEAAADLTAAEAILATGKLSVNELCSHVSQLWCGRGSPGTATTHPSFNERGDSICEFIQS